jgi:uncharacterized protein YjdB
MKKITVSILTTLLMLSMVFSSSVFAANEEVSAWDSFLGLFSGNATTAETDAVGVEYRGHIQNVGNFPLDGTWIQGPNQLGTVGQSLRLEGFWIQLSNQPENVNIQYRVHVQNEGWMAPVENGAFAGTAGKSQQIEAIEINLVDDEGNAVTGYSVMYKGHIQNIGDTAWFEDGQQLGTTGSFLRLEALEVKIVQTKADMTAYNAAVAAAAALTEADYTADSWVALQTALTNNVVTEDNTQAEVDAATAAINAAIDALVMLTKVESVEALNSTSALVTFTAPVQSAKVANFAVTDVDDNTVFVSAVELSADGLTATLAFFDAFEDGDVFDVVTTGITDANGNPVSDEDSFTYVAADAASIEFVKTTVQAGDSLVDSLLVLDTLGRDITDEATIVYQTSVQSVVSTTGIAANPSAPDADTAIVVAKVDVDGEGTYISTPQTVITVTGAEAISLAGYYLTDTPVADTAAFKDLDAEDINTSVKLGDPTLTLAVYYNDQYDQDTLSYVSDFNGTDEPTLRNLTPTVVIVNNDGSITPISVGTGYVRVVNNDITSTLAITVTEEAVLTSMVVDPTVLAVSSAAGVNTATVDISYLDQYGDEVVVAAADLDEESDDTDIATVTEVSANELTITGVAEGTATITVTYDDGDVVFEDTIAVTVKDADGLASYLVDNEYTELDVNGVDDNSDYIPVTSDVNVYSIDSNGVKIAQIALDGTTNLLKEVDENGDDVAISDQLVSFDYTADPTAVITAEADGTAYVQVIVDTLVVETLELKIVNTTPIATTVDFDAVTVNAGEYVASDIDIDGLLYTDMDNGIMTFYDQFGDEITGTVVFTYYITNIDGMTIAPTTPNGAQITAVDVDGGIADIVITGITVDSGDNLLTTPQIVKISATNAV